MVRFRGGSYAGYIYYPHPETKKRHFESASLLALISVYIPEICDGERVELELNAEEIHITNY